MTASALYEGWVAHRRLAPVEHSLRYRVAMPLLDLDELPWVLDRHPLWSARRPALVRWRRRDFLGDPELPLADAARALVRERTGAAPSGPVRLLAGLRFAGHSFNPVSLLYLHDADGGLAAVIAEVTNTPWGERHAYVLKAGTEGEVRETVGKALHVSPFMGMDQSYRVVAGAPGERLVLRITNLERRRAVHEAALSLRRVELTRRAMTRATVAYPAAGLATLGRIYANAARLRFKGLRPLAHPGRV
jgi:DUF1365 family protein